MQSSGHTPRDAVLAVLARVILASDTSHPLRVAIDGVDASGKTTLAEELAVVCSPSGRQVIRASIDGFHRPRADRYRRGRESPDGYYLDSFDYAEVRAAVLEPLGPQGGRSYRLRAFEVERDRQVEVAAKHADVDAVLLFDGVFLLRPELNDCWDLRIFVDVPFDETLRRAVIRDHATLGSPTNVEGLYLQRYIPGQQIYFAAVQPMDIADIVVDNTNPAAPALLPRADVASSSPEISTL